MHSLLTHNLTVKALMGHIGTVHEKTRTDLTGMNL